jgi:eukaryotic-like serine/threonine-protein kinase
MPEMESTAAKPETKEGVPEQPIPAQHLIGLTLANGWKVVGKYTRTDGLSAGRYSVGYFVERDGQKGFLKAIDYSRALKEANLPQALLELTQAFQFERSVLSQCSSRHMDSVITPLEDGEVRVDSSILGRVNYLIFDRADGDIRNTLSGIEKYEVIQRLRILHQVSVGLCQLHGAGIAHQDVKPSNVLSFDQICKIADLGSASIRGNPGPADGRHCAGDKTYAPPELLYGQIDPEFNTRRFGCDCYLLGGLVFFLFTGVGVTSSIISRLDPGHRPHIKLSQTEWWGGTYQEVLPYVKNAFAMALGEFSKEVTIPRLRSELTLMLKQLCEPDPALRGHPLNRQQRHGNPYSLERYRTTFDLLARRASFNLL